MLRAVPRYAAGAATRDEGTEDRRRRLRTPARLRPTAEPDSRGTSPGMTGKGSEPVPMAAGKRLPRLRGKRRGGGRSPANARPDRNFVFQIVSSVLNIQFTDVLFRAGRSPGRLWGRGVMAMRISLMDCGRTAAGLRGPVPPGRRRVRSVLGLKRDSPTARQPDSPTARQPDSPTARQPDSPTARHELSRAGTGRRRSLRAARFRSRFLRSARRAAVCLPAVLALAVLASVPRRPGPGPDFRLQQPARNRQEGQLR